MKRINTLVLMILSASLLLANRSDTLIFDKISLSSDISIPNVTHINSDPLGNLWISTREGIYRYDGYDVIKYISNENEKHGLVKDQIYRTHVSDDGTLWIVGAYSIYKYDTSKNRIIRMSENARKNNTSLYNIGYFDIEDIDNKYMALGSKSGLWIYDKELQDLVILDSLVQDYKIDRYSTNGHVLQIERDPKYPQILWLLTKSGIYNFDCLTRESKLIYYDRSVNFESLNDRGFTMVPKEDYVYLLINFYNLFKYDRSNQKMIEIPQKFDKHTPHHIRNILPHQDGFLIAYIGHGIHHYSESKNEVIPLVNLFEDGTICKSISFVALDHEGKYTFIFNNNKIIKSKDRIVVADKPQEIFTKNLTIKEHLINDTIKDTKIHNLETHERNVEFDIGLTNRSYNDIEQYFYRLNQDDDWIHLNQNRIALKNLTAGNHTVYCQIISNGKSFEAKVKEFKVSPYFYETTWFALLILCGLIGIVSIISYLINLRKKDMKVYREKTLELEMNALRSQMNPHFLFNSINSIKSYVISKNKEEAAEYLTQFAKLIRMILENSRKKYLNIEEEIDMLKLYIIMEQKRLNFSFNYTLEIDPNLDSNFLIAPMLIQPYVENAIWHGLMNKYGDKLLQIDIKNHDDGVLVKIIDNGVGRDATKKIRAENPTSKKSLGLKITEDRIDIIKNIYNIDASVNVIDLFNNDGDAAGTEVQIFLPHIDEILQA